MIAHLLRDLEAALRSHGSDTDAERLERAADAAQAAGGWAFAADLREIAARIAEREGR